jgi:anti-sigma factor RsiW
MATPDQNSAELMTAYLDAELDAAESEAFESFLAESPEAQKELEDLRKVVQLVGKLERVEAPHDFYDLREAVSQDPAPAGLRARFWTARAAHAAVPGDLHRRDPDRRSAVHDGSARRAAAVGRARHEEHREGRHAAGRAALKRAHASAIDRAPVRADARPLALFACDL